MAATYFSSSCLTFLRYALQLALLLIGLTLLALGAVEFFMEEPLFDILGGPGSPRPSLPIKAFNVSSNINSHVFDRLMDLPVLTLFVVYFLTLVWLKLRGYLAWIMTGCMVLAMFLVVAVNGGLATGLLNWRWLTQRAIIIVLDVLILSFGWTAVVMVLLLIRGWFPFKTMKTTPVTRTDKAVAIIGNIIGLYSVLTLCFFIWFTRLYDSWACIDDIYDVLLLCQLTNQIQCYPCANEDAFECVDAGLAECVKHPDGEPFHCLSPFYTISNPHGFCVFNYNIGFFTIVTVFAYVGGIYFFCRTIFKALLKCVKVIGMILIKYCFRIVRRYKRRSSEAVDGESSLSLNKDRISLLASLPKDYASTATKS